MALLPGGLVVGAWPLAPSVLPGRAEYFKCVEKREKEWQLLYPDETGQGDLQNGRARVPRAWAQERSLGLQAWGAMEGYGKAYKSTLVEKVAPEGRWVGRTGGSSS